MPFFANLTLEPKAHPGGCSFKSNNDILLSSIPTQGDLLVHLLEGARQELARPAGPTSAARLQAALEAALRGSSCADDPHGDNLAVRGG